MGSCTLIVGVLKYFLIFGGFVRFDFYPLGLSSYGAFVHFCFSLSTHVITWWECWSSTPVSCDHGIVHLDCWSIKIFSHFGGFCPLWFLSFGSFILWCFCPFWLFSVAYVIAWRECWSSPPVSCYGIVHIDCWSIKIFSHLWGFVHFDFYPLGLSSYGAFVHFGFSLSAHMIAWRECWLSTPVSCDHAIVHIDCWSIKIFSHFGGFYPALIFILWGLSSYVAFVPFCFSLSAHVIAWREYWSSHLYHVIMGSCTFIVGVLKYFLIFRVLSTLIFILWGFRPMVLLSIFAFLCPPTWSHDENVDRPHLYHVIIGSYTLIVGVLKYFLIFGGFVRFDFYPLGLSSYGAFVNFCFSLSVHVIAWRECWSSTPVSCDHGIVHLDCWSITIFSHFWGFRPLWFLSFGALVLWCFCPFLLFSVRPRDRMTRMFIVHTCIMWSCYRTHWLLKY